MIKSYLKVLLLLYPGLVQAQKPIDFVDPFIGTSNFGATNPGAIVPQGMVSVTPFNVTGSTDNTFDKDQRWWSTPYVHENNFLTGFSHVNLSGVGCPELGVIMVMPTTGEVIAEPAKYGSKQDQQTATPGYYSTRLDKYNVVAEVTASQRAGLSKFTFPSGQANILINLGTGLTNETGATLRIINGQEIEGSRMTGGFCYNDGTERPVYFVARLSKEPKEFGAWKKMPKMAAEASWSATSNSYKFYKNYQQLMAGDSIGAWMSFDLNEGEDVMIKVGVSYVSVENARENLDKEMPGFNFEQTKLQAEAAWNKTLSRIAVEGGTNSQKTIFYTGLYHINIHPNVFNDINGEYPMMGRHQVGKTNGRERYTVFSLWDTYRNVHPFLSLVYPEMQMNMVHSMLDMYRESGWLPKWELNSSETHVMEGDPAIPVIVDSYFRGLKDFDTELAYEAMYKSATTAGESNLLRPDIDDYLEKGYVPLMEPFDNSVSHALEYYIADWNLAQFARALGKDKDYKRFYNQSLRYREYFDKEYNMIRPKLSDGTFLTPFDPKQGENFAPSPGFHEGNAWQYTFYVPHDIKGIIKLTGGSKRFVKTLQGIFDQGHFDMANEPDINYPYLFNYVKGEEWRTQKEVRRLIDQYYTTDPAGIPGNDDTGTLSAWVVFSMMGIYPSCPGDMDFALTAPVFDRITIQLDQQYYPGKQLVIEANRPDQNSNYVNRISWNEKPWNKYFISHGELVNGGKLVFDLSHER